MEQTLKNKCIAILVADGFREAQLMPVKTLLTDAGAMTVLISASTGARVSDMENGECELFVDQPISNARADEYDALLIPGGAQSVETLLTHDEALKFIKDFVARKSPVALLGEAVQLAADANSGADQLFTDSANDSDAIKAAGQEVLRRFAAAPPTETQIHTA